MTAIQTELWLTWLPVAGIWLVTVITPGPNFVATSHAALSRGRVAGAWVALGVTVGTAIWATASLLGLGLLFQTAGWLYQIVKLIGAAYLIYFGVRIILSARHRRPPRTPPGQFSATGAWWAFRRGLLTDLANPKAAAFFTSLFAVTIPPAAPSWFIAMVIATVVAIAGAWYGTVALAMAWDPVADAYRRIERVVCYLAGAVFVGFGLRLAADR